MMTLAQISRDYDYYCVVEPVTEQDKIEMYNAVSNPTGKIEDILGDVKELKNVRLEKKRYVDDDEELIEYVQITLLFTDGTSYKTGSKGILYSLSDMFSIFGTPDTWEKPKKIKVKMVQNKYVVVLA